MNPTRKRTLVAGVGLIAIVNAIVLAGVAYNRAGEPESALRLSERELGLPQVSRGNAENSGLSLRLQWRVLPADTPNTKYDPLGYSFGGTPQWLDGAKMLALGFESLAASGPFDARGNIERELPRDVLLVLEMDGAAYQAALARAAKYSETVPDGAKRLQEERAERSRLFVVDAGLDNAVLRARYPDRKHYAIVHGQVRPAGKDRTALDRRAGYISAVSAADLNVPLAWKDVFEEAAAPRPGSAEPVDHYEVEVNFGRRLEPWMASALRKAPQR